MKKIIIFESNWIKGLLLFVSISFLLLYLMLSYNNRLVSDDIFFLNNLSSDGYFGSIFKFNYNKRVSSYFLFNSIFIWNKNLESLHVQIFVFHICTISSFIISISYTVIQVLKEKFQIIISLLDSIFLSFLILIPLFFSTFQLNEVWFWTIASVVHLIPIPLIFISIGLIVKKSLKWYQYVILFLCFLYIGGASETIALSAIMILSSILVASIFSRKDAHSKNQLYKYIVSLIAISIFFGFNLFGDGANNRISLENAQDKSVYISSFFEFLDSFVANKNILFLQFLPLFYLIGMKCRDNEFRFNFRLKRRILLVVIGLIGIGTMATFMPLYYIFNSLGPQRAWSSFGTILSISMLSVFFYLGNISMFKTSNLLIAISTVGIASSILFYVDRQLNAVTEYSAQYDKRINHLLKLKTINQKENVALLPLPDSGMLIRSEISNDPKGWHNQELKEALCLNFDIYEKR